MRPCIRGIASLVILVMSTSCGTGADRAGQAAADSAKVLMDQGLAQLYQSNDPVGAQETFRSIIRNNPTHYGAHYQLAFATPPRSQQSGDDSRLPTRRALTR